MARKRQRQRMRGISIGAELVEGTPIRANTDLSPAEGAAPGDVSVLLATPPTHDVTLHVSVLNGAGASGSPQVTFSTTTLVFTPVNWQPDHALTISAIAEGVTEPDPHRVTVNLTGESTDAAFDGQVEPIDVPITGSTGDVYVPPPTTTTVATTTTTPTTTPTTTTTEMATTTALITATTTVEGARSEPATATARASTQAPSGSLPLTGGGVGDLLVFGLSAVALGCGLAARKRRTDRTTRNTVR